MGILLLQAMTSDHRQQRGGTSLRKLYFLETWKIDIDFLKTYLLEFYNAFVRSNLKVFFVACLRTARKSKVFTRQ